ncbi:MAG: hypothetical protein HYY77_03525 [Betaproteobacteria bacterium]|nr:hypothetical protein [Betaproteobacteria bacterium]
MMHRFTSWFPVVLLAAVAAMTVWLDRQVQPPAHSRDGKARHDPDYIVENSPPPASAPTASRATR